MRVKTLAELIDWICQLHTQLADCIERCATQHPNERTRTLLVYLVGHERALEHMVVDFRRRADANALPVRMYRAHDYLTGDPISIDSTCADLSNNPDYETIYGAVLDFHNRLIELYRTLVDNADTPEVGELFQAMLDMQSNETKQLAQQIARGRDL